MYSVVHFAGGLLMLLLLGSGSPAFASWATHANVGLPDYTMREAITRSFIHP